MTIPESVTAIGDYAFDNCPALTLHIHEGSCAHQYAIDHAIPFELI